MKQLNASIPSKKKLNAPIEFNDMIKVIVGNNIIIQRPIVTENHYKLPIILVNEQKRQNTFL